jgi:hypothetical protein
MFEKIRLAKIICQNFRLIYEIEMVSVKQIKATFDYII